MKVFLLSFLSLVLVGQVSVAQTVKAEDPIGFELSRYKDEVSKMRRFGLYLEKVRLSLFIADTNCEGQVAADAIFTAPAVALFIPKYLFIGAGDLAGLERIAVLKWNPDNKSLAFRALGGTAREIEMLRNGTATCYLASEKWALVNEHLDKIQKQEPVVSDAPTAVANRFRGAR